MKNSQVKNIQNKSNFFQFEKKENINVILHSVTKTVNNQKKKIIFYTITFTNNFCLFFKDA